jgi:hypothetical protein
LVIAVSNTDYTIPPRGIHRTSKDTAGQVSLEECLVRSPAVHVAVVFFVSLLSVRPAVAQSPSDCLVTPGRSVGAINLGMTREAVVRLWGQPDSVETDEERRQLLVFELWRVGIIALSPEGTVTLIGIGDDRCLRTVEGVVTGDTRRRARTVYGEPDSSAEDRLSDTIVKRKARLWIGSAVKDLYSDRYPARGLTILSLQTMHVNGYTRDGTPILVPIDPEPLVEGFLVMVPPRFSATRPDR